MQAVTYIIGTFHCEVPYFYLSIACSARFSAEPHNVRMLCLSDDICLVARARMISPMVLTRVHTRRCIVVFYH